MINGVQTPETLLPLHTYIIGCGIQYRSSGRTHVKMIVGTIHFIFKLLPGSLIGIDNEFIYRILSLFSVFHNLDSVHVPISI